MKDTRPEIQNKKQVASTQKYLEIMEIKDDTLIMKDGSLRAVLLVSSVNFSLKSAEEQEAIISQYISFLNFLEFPIQIVIQSRKLNIDAYLASIKEKQTQQKNELLRLQTSEYIQYIKELVELGEIMSKKFYVVVPFVPGGDQADSFFVRLGQIFSPVSLIRLKDKQFEEYNKKLAKRLDQVAGSLSGMGITSVRLDTQGLIELFYNTYNLEVHDQQKMAGSGELQLEEE